MHVHGSGAPGRGQGPAKLAQRRQRLPDYLGGPFEDRTGGLIIFTAENVERAERAVNADPFIREGLLTAYWLKQWTVEGIDST